MPKSLKGKVYLDQTFRCGLATLLAKFSSNRICDGTYDCTQPFLLSCLPPDLERTDSWQSFLAFAKSPVLASKCKPLLVLNRGRRSGEGLAKDVHDRHCRSQPNERKTRHCRRTNVMDLERMKVTPRDQQVLDLLVQGCSNKEIAGQLSISPRTVKQHLRTLFLRAGIREGRKRVRLATAAFERAEVKS